jgi:saccharopine dehydrogenase (NAD+, L-lysine forming)
MKIGIIREGKVPPDKRVPFTPKQCKRIMEKFPKVQVMVQSSASRSYMDEQYDDQCIIIEDSIDECDVLFGIKEVPISELIEGKTYFIFSHTIKKQQHNKGLLKAILEKNIRLIDYELLTDNEGNRLVGFGRIAGLVGAYNGFRGFAIRNKLREPKPAHTLDGIEAMLEEAKKMSLPPIKIALTGAGRVAGGVKELLESMNIKEVDVDSYLKNETFKEAVFVQLKPDAYNMHKEGKAFDLKHFYKHPEEYTGNFKRFYTSTDMFISSAFWDPKAPELFTEEDMRQPDFRIKVIADVTCDIKGSIPSTLRAGIIEDPFYGYNPETESEELAFTNPKNITVMAVDNLPNELPHDASKEFGKSLIEKILPSIVKGDNEGILERATIARDGKLSQRYSFLSDWVSE